MHHPRLNTALVVLLYSAVFFHAPRLHADVTLVWDPDSDPAVVGYRLYSGTTSGVYTQSSEAGSATSMLVSNLTAGQTYYFAVTGYTTAAVESSFSNEVSYTVASSSPTPTPSPSPSPSATPNPSATPSPSPSPGASISPTPAATPSHVQGSGSINGPNGADVSFNMNVQAQNVRGRTKIAGSFSCNDTTGALSVSTAKINTLTFNGNQARFTTTTKIRKVSVTFTVTATENAQTGTPGTFSIQGSNGLSISGPLINGGIIIN